MKPVAELLKKRTYTEIYSVSPGATVFEAITLLAEKGVGALMVIEQGNLVGIFSERDYTRKIAILGKNSREALVSDIMTSPVLYVTPSHRTRECMALMSDKKVRHLPVLDNGRVVGMLSIRDLMNDIIADHEFTIAQLESYINQ
ncbi:histidine kinase [Betaproteobacteria bacterium UKL13-2]|nr:histidine kinase [Betaproteobacteria bacterium UKL13-2]HCG53643.1 histidine kinase [Betaproteobacteria bacterium]